MALQQGRGSPYQVLQAIENGIRQHDLQHDAQGPHQAYWMGLSFMTGDLVLITPLDEIMEIMRLTQLAPIPQVKAFVRGIASSRGELIPITDLSVFLTKKPPKTSHHSRILVIKNNDQQVGLLVDRVFGLQRMQRDTIAHHTQTGISEINPYIIGTLENPTVELPIISCKKIVKSELFRQTNLVKSQLKDEEGKV